MKKSFLKTFLPFLLPVFAIVLFAACSKSTDKPAYNGRTKEYKMYNVSSGTSVEAGSFILTELENGNAKINVQLNVGYRVSGAKFKTNITVPQANGTELLFADLGEMDGGSGTLEVNPLVSGATNVAVKYNDIIAQTGYIVKVMNASNVQARGSIQ